MYKAETIAYLKDAINFFREMESDKRTLERERLKIYEAKMKLYVFENNIINDDQLWESLMLTRGLATLAMYDAGSFYQQMRKEKGVIIEPSHLDNVSKDSIVFIAVGNTPVLNKVVLSFNEKGHLRTNTRNILFTGTGLTLNDMGTHPRPEDFTINIDSSPADRYYKYRPGTIGQVLRHELAHDGLTAQRMDRGKASNWSEYDTDVKAMEGIRKAWKKWEKSGFKDNSGYYFVFSLPEGGYILTKHEPSDSATSDSQTL